MHICYKAKLCIQPVLPVPFNSIHRMTRKREQRAWRVIIEQRSFKQHGSRCSPWFSPLMNRLQLSTWVAVVHAHYFFLKPDYKTAQIVLFLEADLGFLIWRPGGICHFWEPHKELKATSLQGCFLLSNLPELELFGCSSWHQPHLSSLHSSCIIPKVDTKNLCASMWNINQMRNTAKQLALQNQ